MPANRISGRVVLKESGIGIPDLLVVIHDIDPESQTDGARERAEHEEPEEGQRTVRAPGGPGDRLGSSLTDRDGAFHLSFEDNEFRIQDAKERRPDLHLVVMAPEEPGVGPRVLFTSPESARTPAALRAMSSDCRARF